MSTDRVCRTCRYFDGPRPPNGELVDAGLCRFTAPAESAGVGYTDRNGKVRQVQRGTWPLTVADDWCGEWTDATSSAPLGRRSTETAA